MNWAWSLWNTVIMGGKAWKRHYSRGNETPWEGKAVQVSIHVNGIVLVLRGAFLKSVFLSEYILGISRWLFKDFLFLSLRDQKGILF